MCVHVAMDVDGVLERIGEFGRTQWTIFIILGFATMYTSLNLMVLPLSALNPGWNCTAISPSAGEKTVASDDAAKCLRYEQGECVPEFTRNYTSIVTEWNLICSKSHYPNFAQSGVFVGLLLGSGVFGTLADRFGRKRVFFLTLLLSAVSTFLSGLSTNFTTFLILKVAIGFFNNGMILASFSLVMEIVGITKRSIPGIVGHIFFPTGFVVLSLLAYWTHSWRYFTIIASMMGFALLFLWRWIPESPRWLLVNGREEEARRVLLQIARGNGSDSKMPSCELKKPPTKEIKSSVSILDLFRGRSIRRLTFISIIAWFTDCAMYYILSISSGSFGSNIFVSYSLSGLIEFPSFVIAYIVITRFGRRWAHSGFLFVAGFSCLVWVLLNWLDASGSLKLAVALQGKSAIAGAFGTIYLYSAEFFPTQVRNLGLGISSIGARIGGIGSPLVLLLASYYEGLPMALMGCLAVGTGVLGLALPETLNQPMPETLQDLEEQFP